MSLKERMKALEASMAGGLPAPRAPVKSTGSKLAGKPARTTPSPGTKRRSKTAGDLGAVAAAAAAAVAAEAGAPKASGGGSRVKRMSKALAGMNIP